ncbi:MAG: RNA-binding transcriptional accessory protein [Candidatus Scalindua sp. AMX11]|nr:MAG: RNA-binding transcriptional accessory protein [Candidatus Scalindua sp.]NOG82461.1 RNA-binding transcriptional accessory protein [Planctomycetota bacterium]RZV93897.1 MAG: RNA-binding transcriptional accessory protein [Candidatus Scalindua sp. SCAELEC01]TDE65517.1 MAG: RNA-binding transcriptional accessory protein [Candidatus Scalindua sp. AMX11]GJQ58098.1 MAG: RNA-binding transcriptional accessory protein [Candidatus Scalindua sp.]
MDKEHIVKITEELNLKTEQVQATGLLLDEGATVPFIARYRKEATGTLDEVAITRIRDRFTQLRELDKRREAILKSLEDAGKLTDELKKKITAAETLTLLEDIYLPYRPKRRTRATIAREKGLEPLAKLILEQEEIDLQEESLLYIDTEKGVASLEDALAGARDIIAEWINEDQQGRVKIRELFASKGVFRSKIVSGKEEEGLKYKDYFDWEESVGTAPSHRVLAMRRGEKEGFLILRVVPPEEDATSILESLFVKGDGESSKQVIMAVHDSYKRLLSPSIETEIRLETKKRADETAIKVFAENLRQLLLASSLGQKNVMAIDPGFRTGCKVVCLDRQGALVHTDVIYPHQSDERSSKDSENIAKLCERFKVEAIAIGNGTASRETEAFVKKIKLPEHIQVVIVNESGASIYSASEVAREEFPDYDITVRGAVSIGRRLMDPLAELVKIEPKSIGVGQYQHDIDQNALKQGLDDVVISCVNAVGVEINTASPQLLQYVSGLGPQLARNIVAYRNEHGPLTSRAKLKKVPKLGPKAFEQAAGFLRIRDGENPLDRSAVHPESYKIVDAMSKDLGCSVQDLMDNEEMRSKINLEKFVTDAVGMPTLLDIKDELTKPGRDPREKFEAFSFVEGVEKIEDVEEGMQLPGIVTNITAFGAFVDIGVHQDGLVHISQLSNRFVKDPNEVVKVHQKVQVTVLGVDLQRSRISLSMK